MHPLLASFISTARSARMRPVKLALVGLLLGSVACDGHWELEQELQTADAPAAGIHGLAVSINAKTAAITVADPAGVDIYERDDAGAWSFVQRILPRTGMPLDATFRFGESVAVDNHTLAIGVPKYIPGGAYYMGSEYGYIEIYRRADSAAPFVYDHTVRPTIAPGTITSSNFATSIDLENDLLVAGSNFDTERIGRVFVFRERAGVFEQWQMLTDPAPTSDAHFGFAVDLSGSRLAVAQPGITAGGGGFSRRNGKVVLYLRGETGFAEEERVVCPEEGPPGGGDRFASAIALDGQRLAVSRPGRVYLFDHKDSTTFNHKYSVDAAVGDYFTARPSLELTPLALIVGEPLFNSGAGRVQVYDVRRPTVYSTLLDPAGLTRNFGAAVAASNHSMVVSTGAAGASANDTAYTYRLLFEEPAP